ncbi:MAG: tRNA uridine-5-carboxymethylaminomethyl(34) synthesis GTPase MnmE, partial [Gammaproteobacteria bacterium]|nr:tRNA uridine-5-carboxymethylaminomethyl(34) synthesis GTPase MnmE [Gammaproteobacteria bacterium]
ESDDEVEREGVRRARAQIARADHALWVFDGISDADGHGLATADLPASLSVTRVRNKADISGKPVGITEGNGVIEIHLSAKTGEGVDLLREHLKHLMAYQGTDEGDFSARRRHLDAIEQARDALQRGEHALRHAQAGELLAEELRIAQQSLSTITGEFSADDLLGEIFASFCIGK